MIDTQYFIYLKININIKHCIKQKMKSIKRSNTKIYIDLNYDFHIFYY